MIEVLIMGLVIGFVAGLVMAIIIICLCMAQKGTGNDSKGKT